MGILARKWSCDGIHRATRVPRAKREQRHAMAAMSDGFLAGGKRGQKKKRGQIYFSRRKIDLSPFFLLSPFSQA
jgi:hypothetical protein